MFRLTLGNLPDMSAHIISLLFITKSIARYQQPIIIEVPPAYCLSANQIGSSRYIINIDEPILHHSRIGQAQPQKVRSAGPVLGDPDFSPSGSGYVMYFLLVWP